MVFICLDSLRILPFCIRPRIDARKAFVNTNQPIWMDGRLRLIHDWLRVNDFILRMHTIL
jgi:hypothetical protein